MAGGTTPRKTQKIKIEREGRSTRKDVREMTMIVRKRNGLTEQQRRFIEYYAQTGNAKEAAIKAGYSKTAAHQLGYKLLDKPKIQEGIAFLAAQMSSERIANAQEIQEHWTAVMRGETTEEVPMNVGTGKGHTQIEKVRVQVSAKERLKAAELLAKAQGMFINKQELNVQGSLPVVIRDDL